jgi:hypothetical protein
VYAADDDAVNPLLDSNGVNSQVPGDSTPEMANIIMVLNELASMVMIQSQQYRVGGGGGLSQ